MTLRQGKPDRARVRNIVVMIAALGVSACQTSAVGVGEAPAPSSVSGGEAAAPDTMRWLYGSGEAAAASIQTWRQIADFAIARAAASEAASVPLGLPDVEGGVATTNCAGKPAAAVFDVDETVLLNTGYEYWQALSGRPFDAAEWSEWSDNGAGIAKPVPGAVTGLRRLRDAGITVIFNTNRNTENAAGTVRALAEAGAGEAVHLQNLFLRGDDAMGSRKDGRRATIAERYCIVALAGDNLGDFADVLNADEAAIQQRRTLAARGEYAQLWGNGWFLVPNPVYGAWQHGTLNEVFPADDRWRPATAGGNDSDTESD